MDEKTKIGEFGKCCLFSEEGEVVNEFVAGSRGTWKIEYTAGSSGINRGGGIVIVPPCRSMTRWEVGHVEACTDRCGVGTEVHTENIYPISYHLWRYPIIRVIIRGGCLQEGDHITVILGAEGEYLSGFYRRAKVQEFAMEDTRFDVLVDSVGNAQFPEEVRVISSLPHVERSPSVRVVSAPPTRLKVILRAAPRKAASQIICVAAEDAYGNPAPSYQGKVKVLCRDGDVNYPTEYAFAEENKGHHLFFDECSFPSSEFHRITVIDEENELIARSNPVSPGFAHPFQIYFGDLHVMTGQTHPSIMVGTTHQAYLYARDIAGLDFVAITNGTIGKHVHSWSDERKEAAFFNEPYKFVTLLAYECIMKNGHKNVYYPDDSESRCNPERAEELWEFLEDRKALVVPHHTNIVSETDPEEWGIQDWSTHNPRFERLVEICQIRGSFETEDVGGKVFFGGRGSSVQSALRKGYRLGFVGGTDNHRAQPGSGRSPLAGLDYHQTQTAGLTAVLADELTWESIWEALWSRRCYATTGERILLWFAVNGHLMGEEIDLNTEQHLSHCRNIQIKVVGTRNVQKVELVRNNAVVHTFTGNRGEGEFTYQDKSLFSQVAFSPPRVSGENVVYYYARITQTDGSMAWSSPVWIIEGR